MKGWIIMTNIWRIHLRKGGVGDSVSISDYCIHHMIAAMGWILNKKENDDIKNGKIIINSYQDYAKYAEKVYDKFDDVRRLAEEVKPGDFIWTRCDNIYYLAKVSENSKYHYNSSDAAIENDACNQLTNIEWKRIGDDQVVDTNIIKKEWFEQGQTLRRLINPEKNENSFKLALKYTQDIYN